jgi:hypothetical protein
VWVALIGAPAASAQCGQRTTGYPAHWRGGGPPPLVIGDSVLYEVVPALARLGFQSDAMVCRQFTQGLALLSQRRGSLPHLVILELGTNGTVTGAEIDQALAILGPHRLLALITPHDGVVPSDIATMLAAQREHRRRILILDWNRLAAAHPYWLAGDGIHLSGAGAIAGFARMVATLLPYAAQPPCLPRS